MKNILIIGCGLLGSSLVRKISRKKIAKKNTNLRKIKKKYFKNQKIKATWNSYKKTSRWSIAIKFNNFLYTNE